MNKSSYITTLQNTLLIVALGCIFSCMKHKYDQDNLESYVEDSLEVRQDNGVTKPLDYVILNNKTLTSTKRINDKDKITPISNIIEPIKIVLTSANNKLDDDLLEELKRMLKTINANREDYNSITLAYEKVKIDASQCAELREGFWYKKSQPFINGLKSAEILGVPALEFEKYAADKAIIQNIINSIRTFEDLCFEIESNLDNELIGNELFLDIMSRLGHYFESLYLLRNLLQLKKIDSTKADSECKEFKRYVLEEHKSKDTQVIHASYAELLLKRINKIIFSIESGYNEHNLTDDRDKIIVATPYNLVKYSSMLDFGKNLIGGRIDPTVFDSNLDIYTHKSKLKPGSVYWTLLECKNLIDGTWSNLILPSLFTSEEKSIVKIFHYIHDLIEVYDNYVRKISQEYEYYLQGREDTSETDLMQKYRKIIAKCKSDGNFISKHEKGKQAIIDTRKLLNKTGKFSIGRSSPTEGLYYVGKWKLDHTDRQIRVDQYEGMIGLLDYLSAVAIQIDSEMNVSSLINYTKVLNKGKPSWIYESEQEQKARMDGVSGKRTFFALIVSFVFNGVVDVVSHVSIPFAAAMLGAQALLYAYNVWENA